MPERESLIRDIHDGTLSCEIPAAVRASLAAAHRTADARPGHANSNSSSSSTARCCPNMPGRVSSVLAVWTGGSVSVSILQQLPALYGDAPIRDHGLSASEGRMTIPLADGTAAGLLDFYHHYFEFIPVEEHDSADPNVLEGHELEEGRDYYIVLTTSGGLYRYDIHDVVRCVGFEGRAPLVEFLNKGKNFSSLTGEKLSEHQAIRAVETSFPRAAPADSNTFTLAPGDGGAAAVRAAGRAARTIAAGPPNWQRRVQANLDRINEEYARQMRQRTFAAG